MFRESQVGVEPYQYSLSPHGFNLARQIGGRYLKDCDFTDFIIPGTLRCMQTLGAMSEGAKDWTTGLIRHEPKLLSRKHKELKELISEIESDNLNVLMRSEPKLFKAFQTELIVTLWKTLREMKIETDSRVLMIVHDAQAESIVEALTEKVIDPLKHCEGLMLNMSYSFWRIDATKFPTEFRST
ncbi:MAG: hypothetical protein WCJ29_01325 [bacterium]